MGYKKKSITKRGRVQDRRKIALTSQHERVYIKKIANEFLGYLNKFPKQKKLITTAATKKEIPDKFSVSSARRICKALLKCLK